MANKEPKPEPIVIRIQAAKWMLTMSDLLTLMLTFFVLLISMSSMDDAKLQTAFGLFAGAFGAMNEAGQMGLTPGFTRPIESEQSPTAIVAGLEDSIEHHIRGRYKKNPPPAESFKELDEYRNQFSVDRTDDAIEVRIAGGILFEPKSATLSPDSEALLREVSDEVASKGWPVRVESYVKPEPGQQDLAWDLSLERAAAVTDVLASRSPSDEKLLSLAGYGRPLEGDDSESGEVVRLLFFSPKEERSGLNQRFQIIDATTVDGIQEENNGGE